MQITDLHLTNFRCFTQLDLAFTGNLVLIEGLNGVGKTSLLEALHYVCYLRSFKTHTPREIMRFGQESFFVRVGFTNQDFGTELSNELQVGFSGKKRLVKLNQKAICSYKELMDHYRIVTLTEDDLALIKGAPEERRTFLDQALLMASPAFMEELKAFRQVADSRNTLLQSGTCSKESYRVWTQQLFEKSRGIAAQRQAILKIFQESINSMLADKLGLNCSITFEYQQKNMTQDQSFEEFFEGFSHQYTQEMRFGRSLFGAHLDDFLINFQEKKSRSYASRGQQKLIVVLLKVAQLAYLHQTRGASIMLLDDFMTDFDEQKASVLLSFLTSLGSQLIVTAPEQAGFFEQKLTSLGAQRIKLTN